MEGRRRNLSFYDFSNIWHFHKSERTDIMNIKWQRSGKALAGAAKLSNFQMFVHIFLLPGSRRIPFAIDRNLFKWLVLLNPIMVM